MVLGAEVGLGLAAELRFAEADFFMGERLHERVTTVHDSDRRPEIPGAVLGALEQVWGDLGKKKTQNPHP